MVVTSGKLELTASAVVISRGGLEFLCPALITALGMDTAKRRVTESNQRAGLACRGETTRHVKLLLRFVEVLRIRRPASPADQESRPCFVSFCLLRHRDLH